MIPSFDPRWGPDPKPRTRYARQRQKGTHLGWKWWRQRKAFLRRFPYCADCGAFGTEVHHIKPRHTHPELTYDWSNLKTLCKECHHKAHKDHQ